MKSESKRLKLWVAPLTNVCEKSGTAGSFMFISM